ncbi:NACHT domain-containing protein [Micromonospora noduli]|uniref:NACHT domain-containing protein n=1 Tax=Micromonospora noduli TaxID=709876 RepID=UPI00341BC936
MVSNVEVQVTRTAGKAVMRLGARLADAARRDGLLFTARPTVAVGIADSLLRELSPEETLALAKYLDSPDFEHLAVQLVVVARYQDQRWQEDARSGVRDAIRHGLRHAGAFSSERLLPITDLVFGALLVACQQASAEIPGSHLDSGVLAAASHIGAMAARNGRLLATVRSLAGFHEAASQLRGQVRALHSELRIPHIGLVRSVPWDELYVEPLLTAEREQDPQPAIERLAEPGQRLVILGDPGAGKSTLATKLAFDIAGADTAQVPFLVVLRDLSDSLTAGRRRLVDHLVALAHDPYNVDLDPDAVDYLLLNGRAVVILDGIDELTEVALRQRVVRLVDSFAALYPLVPMIVTSRRVGYAEAPLTPNLFRTCRITSFDEERVESYAQKWFALDRGVPRADRDRLQRSFLRESESINDLRSNPMLLSLLSSMYSTEQYLPRNRAQVYERCALMVFDRWDAVRGIRMPMQFHGHVRGAVQELARHMFVQGAPELPRRQVLHVLTGYLRNKGFDDDEADRLAAMFLDFCAGRTWVLVEVGATETEPLYGFAHRTFLEYFSAEHLVRHHPSPDALWTVLEKHLGQGEWEVVAQLAVQLLDRNRNDGATELLGLVFDALSQAEPPLRVALTGFMARACGAVAAPPKLVDQIVQAALAAVTTAKMSTRVRFWRGGASDNRDTDEPLHALMYDSLGGNLRYIRRSVSDRLSELAAAGNDVGLYLMVQGLRRPWVTADESRVAVWRDLHLELVSNHEREIVAWRARHPWSWSRAGRNSVEALIDAFGPAPLYLSDRILTGSTWPHLLYLAHDGTLPRFEGPAMKTAQRIRQRLIREPTPWLPGVKWWLEFSDSGSDGFELPTLMDCQWPKSGEDLATFLVLFLPYLETLADAPATPALSLPSDVANALIWTRRLAEKEAADLSRRLPRSRMPMDCWSFLLRWTRREISVVGRVLDDAAMG